MRTGSGPSSSSSRRQEAGGKGRWGTPCGGGERCSFLSVLRILQEYGDEIMQMCKTRHHHVQTLSSFPRGHRGSVFLSSGTFLLAFG